MKYLNKKYIEYKGFYIEDNKDGSYSVVDNEFNFIKFFDFDELEEVKKWLDKQ